MSGPTGDQLLAWYNYIASAPKKNRKILTSVSSFIEFYDYKNVARQSSRFEDLYVDKKQPEPVEQEQEEDAEDAENNAKWGDFIATLKRKRWDELWSLAKMVHSKSDGSIALPRIPPKPRKAVLVKFIEDIVITL